MAFDVRERLLQNAQNLQRVVRGDIKLLGQIPVREPQLDAGRAEARPSRGASRGRGDVVRPRRVG